jgi:hypothetical protein
MIAIAHSEYTTSEQQKNKTRTSRLDAVLLEEAKHEAQRVQNIPFDADPLDARYYTSLQEKVCVCVYLMLILSCVDRRRNEESMCITSERQ